MTSESLSIGQVAELTGLSVHTLRFYERERLFSRPIRRSSNGRRMFDSRDVDWLRLCSRLRESGMPLHAIRHYAALVAAGPGNEAERLEVLRAHQERVGAQLEKLRVCLDMITAKVDHYTDALSLQEGDPFWHNTDSAADTTPA